MALHCKERKELQKKITSLKKQASKTTRKQVNLKCEQLTRELEQSQALEMKKLKIERGVEQNHDEVEDQSALVKQIDEPKPAVKHRNRRRERLARREEEISKMKKEASAEAAMQPDLKNIELETLSKICELNGLKQVDIRPDGHCLFASILDQLKIRHNPESCQEMYLFPRGYKGTKLVKDMDVYSLRHISCNYVCDYRDDFIPYLFDEETACVEDIVKYVQKIENTAHWGGEIELLALSKVFRCRISIMMSGSSAHIINEAEKTNPELKLVYYKHGFFLGEHYNSLHDA